jgi:hypothetical protein
MRLMAVAAASIAMLMSAPRADAAFPGRDGRVVFELAG